MNHQYTSKAPYTNVLSSLIPESPRYLISKDRREEAFEILVKYHAEGDRDSPIVHAEFAQIESTIKLELEQSKMSWRDVIRSPGNRKRLLIGSLLGLFTQWSGNTLISYYLGDILEQAGYTDSNFQAKFNVGYTCWQLVNAAVMALIVKKFARRKMYLTCATSLLCCYIGWTISMARYQVENDAGHEAQALVAGKLVLFFIYLYSPCYNMGYNALTYSKPILTTLHYCEAKLLTFNLSLPRRTLPLLHPLPRYHSLPILGSRRRLLQHLR
jgi:hypothetical protein